MTQSKYDARLRKLGLTVKFCTAVTCNVFLRPTCTTAREVCAGEDGKTAFHVNFTRTLAAVLELSIHPSL